MGNAIIQLKKAGISDAQIIHEMQVQSFKPLLDKYQDFDTNPAKETLERVKARFDDNIDHYLICLQDENIGYIRVRCADENNHHYVLTQIFIAPEYQGKGYAQAAIKQVELLYPKAQKWMLDTIKQEKKLCRFYEKLGYKLTGLEKNIIKGMDLVYYEKE